MKPSDSDQNRYEWLYDAESQPEVQLGDTTELPPVETPDRPHRLRRGVLAATAVVVAVGGLAALAYAIERHHESSGPHEAAQSTQSAQTLSPKVPTQADCIAKLPLRLKLAQKLMIGADASNLSEISAVAAEYNLGGVILMGPVPSADMVKAMEQAQSYPLLVATDQEGGTVQRYKTGGTLPAAADVPALWSVDTAEARVRQADEFLKTQGVNMNLAPLADVAPATGSSVLGSRIFSDDPSVVARYDQAYVRAGLAAGVLPTLKHFPGLGAATGNTDYGPAESPAQLIPYRSLAGTKAAVMVGNQTVPNISGSEPASLSENVITNLLRNQLGYKNNVVITDALNAAAITSRESVTTASVDAWEAGADIALIVEPQSGISSEAQIRQILTAGEAAVTARQLGGAAVNQSIERLWGLPQKQIDACQA